MGQINILQWSNSKELQALTDNKIMYLDITGNENIFTNLSRR